MNQNKLSSRVYTLIKSAGMAVILPVLFIYIMVAKPDYAILNGLAHVVLPVANWVGNVITWPIRAIGDAVDGVHELSTLRTENEELRVRLDQALANKTQCEIAIKENQKMARELDVVAAQPYKTIVADVMHDNTAFHHSVFIINRGTDNGVLKGMAVVSMDNKLAGIVIDAGGNFARVRALTDVDTNIAVRVVGSEVYGFMAGNGSAYPTIGFFSDPEFQPTNGIKIITSNISGVLPAGLLIGEIVDETDVKVKRLSELSRVIVQKFDTVKNEYK